MGVELSCVQVELGGGHKKREIVSLHGQHQNNDVQSHLVARFFLRPHGTEGTSFNACQ